MTRSVPASIMAALMSSDPVDVFLAVEFGFDSGTLRLWSGVGDLTIGGLVYTGGGDLLDVSGLDEVQELEAKGVTLTLSGVPADLTQRALAETVRYRPIKVLYGVEGTGETVVAFSGLMDKMPLEDDGETATIQVMAESKLITLERARVFRYTHESQQVLHPGDTFFSHVASLQDKEIIWGRKSNNA